ncbi:isoamyl acetate-hydrolyzing esterase [Coemansia erecta]|nr:isoamyl acetate-hydrolyzing esterase [Coemansia sp. RSA 2618]KAJ2826308.1 isoamyl acetate-hydrolyzing esterase [Coemansia erecta]
MAFSRNTVRALIASSIIALFTFNYFLISAYVGDGGSLASTEGGTAYEYPGYDVLLAFGDSITQIGSDPDNSGYMSLLSRYYERQMDVINRGFAGYNSTGGRQVVHRVFPKTRTKSHNGGSWLPWLGSSSSKSVNTPELAIYKSTGSIWPERNFNFPSTARKLQLCIIFFGTNDAQTQGNYGHNTPETFAEDLRYFVSLLRSPDSEHYSPGTRILFITPPATGDLMIQAVKRKVHAPMIPNRNVKALAEVVKHIATEAGAPYVDLYSAIENRVHPPSQRAMLISESDSSSSTSTETSDAAEPTETPSIYDGYDEFLIDGVHLNPAGNRLLFELITAKINQTWPELKPSAPIAAIPPQ